MRLKLKEPEEFSKNSMKHTRTPYLLVLRCYGWRLLAVSLIWFIYDVRTSKSPLRGGSRSYVLQLACDTN